MMQTSAYQMMRKEIDNLQKAVAQRDEMIEQLQAAGQHQQQMITGLQMTVATLVHCVPEKRRRWTVGTKRSAIGSVRVPKALIEEVQTSPHHFEARQTRDEKTGAIVFTTRRRTAAEVAEIEARVKAEQAASVEAARKAQEERQASASIVAPDGRPAREAAKSKILVVQ